MGEAIDKLKKLTAEMEASRPKMEPVPEYDPKTSPLLARIATLEAENARLEARVKRLVEALTPSTETKAAYIGEFEWEDEVDYGEGTLTRTVPWATIKEIMAAIRERAALKEPQP